MSGVSHPWPRLAELIKDSGMSYRALAAKTGIKKSTLGNIVTGDGEPGVWPTSVPKLKALAAAIGKPWAAVRDAVNLDTGTTIVAEYEGAKIVVAEAEENLRGDELRAWEDMSRDLIELLRRRRGGEEERA